MDYNKLVDKIAKKYPDLEQLFADSKNKLVTVTFCNPFNLKILEDDPDYFKYLEDVDYIYADGILLVSFIEKVTKQHCDRAAFDGNSIAPEVFCLAKKLDRKVALIGTTDEYINIAAKKLADTMNVVYHRNGFFKNETEINELMAGLAETKADVVIFGMGAPYQEKMLQTLRDRNFIGIAFTCGGYLEQLAKTDLTYYPDFINKYHLRSFYRVYKEPVKMLKRYIVDYSTFYKIYARLLLKGA